ncbi:MAG: acyl-CoA thioesterase domain-containing protein [Burkholderiales bacterium]
MCNQFDAEAIRRQVLRGLAGNRTPGFHFAGYFLQLAWPRIGDTSVDETMTPGPHCLDADGELDLAALGVMIDTALATAPRLRIAPGARQATVQLNVQFTGHPARGELLMTSELLGFSEGTAVRQSLATGTLFAQGKPVCYANATFMLLPAPEGVKLAPLPWQRESDGTTDAPLELKDLGPDERAVMRACDAALKRADNRRAFIEHFWSVLPEATAHGARCSVKNGPHIGNRVGHVQGGILLGLAAATAKTAVPRHPMLSGIAAWFVSPGKGKTLRVRSKVVHAGRSFAVVRTEIKTTDGKRVLEVVSDHAARSA